MSYDVSDNKGFCIKAKTLLKGSYPPDAKCVNDDTESEIECLMADNEWMLGLVEDSTNYLTGSWYGDFPGGCPFDDDIYVVFDARKLLDVQRKNGKSVYTESKRFARLKKFMRKHKIPAEALVYHEWQVGG